MTEHTTPEGDTINLVTGCDTCQHVADTVGIGLEQPAAVNAVANVLIADLYPKDGKHHERNAATVLAFIRDAIHRDGDDADAIRQTLGLRLNDSWVPVCESGSRWVRRTEADARYEMENWPKGVTYSDGSPGDGITHIVKERCVVSNWQEVPDGHGV